MQNFINNHLQSMDDFKKCKKQIQLVKKDNKQKFKFRQITDLIFDSLNLVFEQDFKPIVILNSVRLIKDLNNLEIEKITQRVMIQFLQKIKEIAEFNQDCPNFKKGQLYFGENQDHNTQVIGNSLVRLSLECVKVWAFQNQNHPQNIDYSKTYQNLLDKGINFPNDLIYFTKIKLPDQTDQNSNNIKKNEKNYQPNKIKVNNFFQQDNNLKNLSLNDFRIQIKEILQQLHAFKIQLENQFSVDKEQFVNEECKFLILDCDDILKYLQKFYKNMGDILEKLFSLNQQDQDLYIEDVIYFEKYIEGFTNLYTQFRKNQIDFQSFKQSYQKLLLEAQIEMRNSQEIQSQNEKNRQIQQRQFIEVENISQDDQKIQQPVTKDNPKNQSFQVQQNDSRQSKQTFQKNIFNEDKLSNDKSKNIQQNNQNYQDGQQKQSSQRQNFQDSQVLNKPQIQINTEKLQNEIDAKNMTAEKIYNHSSSDLNVSFENQEKIVPNKNQVQNISNQTRNLQKVKQMNMDYHNNSQNSKQDQVKQFIGQPQVNEYKNLVPVAKRNSKQNIKIKPMTMKNQGVDDYQINENSSQNQIENPKKFERRIQNTNSRQSNHSEDPKYILIQSKNQNYNQDRDIKDKSQKNVKFHDQSEQALEYKKQQGNYMQENTKKIQINHQSKQNELVNDQSIINDEDYDFDSQQKQPKNILIKIDTQSNFEREKLSKKQDHNIIQNNFMRKSHDKSINEIDQQSSPFKKQIKPDQRELIDKKVYLKQHDDIDPEPESENEYDQNLNIVQSQYNDKNRQFQLQHRNSRFTFTQNNNIENQSHQKIYSQNDNVDKLIRQLDKESPLNLQQSNDSYQYQSKQKNKDSQEILCHIQKSHNKYDQANNQDCDLQSLMEESNVKQSNQHQKFEHISKNKQIQSHTLEKSQKIANQIRQNSNQVIKTNNQVNNSFIDEIERKKQLFNQQMKQFDKGQIQKQSLVNDSTNRVQNIQRLNQQSQQKLVKDSQSSRKIQDFNSFYQESQDGEQNIQKQQVQRNLIFQSQNIQDSQISLIDEKQEQINKIQGIHGNDNDQKEKMITQQIVKHDISINQFSMESNKQSKLNSPLKQNEKQDQVSGEKTIKSEIKIKFIQKVIFLYEMNDELVKEKSDLLMKIDMLNRSLYEKDQENIRLQNSHSQLENTVSNLNKSLTISQRRSNSPKIFQQKSFTRNYSSSKEQKTIFKSRNNSSYFDNSTDMNQSNSKFTNLPFKRLIPSKLTKNTIVIEYNIEVFKQLTIKMGNTNLTRFKLSCIQDKCSLFKNEQIKVGIIKDYNHHNDNVFVRMDLYFENLTYDPISNLYCEFAHDDDGKIFISEILIWEQSSILIKNLMGKTQKKEEIIISLLKSPFQLIHLHGNFQCNDNPVIFNTILPCTLLNYMIYSTIKKDIFKQQFSNSFVFTTNRFKLNRNLIKINQDFLAIFPLSVDILKNGKQAKYQFCQGTQFIINQSQQYYLKLKVYMDDSVKISIGCPDQDTKNQTIKSILQTLMFILKK